MKLRQRQRQRRRRRRWRPREELQEEERRQQRVCFSAATLSQARLVPPPPEASALAPRLPPARCGARDRPEGGATRVVAARHGEERAAVFPHHPPLDAPQPAPGSAILLSGRKRRLYGHLRLSAPLSPGLPSSGFTLSPVPPPRPPSRHRFPGPGSAPPGASAPLGFSRELGCPETPASSRCCGWALLLQSPPGP